MFCSNCGKEVASDSQFCSHCGKHTQGSSNITKPVGQFGRAGVKSFIDYKASNGRPCKATLEKGKKGKRDDNNGDKEVVIKIGLMTWDANDKQLKEKRAKRLALRISNSANYETIRKKATEKWKNFWRNLYQEGKEYAVLLEDGQEARFLPGAIMEAFTLKRYREEVLKDYKRITLYLCTIEDLSSSERARAESGDDDVKLSTLDDNADHPGCSTWVPSRTHNSRLNEIQKANESPGVVKKEHQICLSDSEDELDVDVKRWKQDSWNSDGLPSSCADEAQIKNDQKIAWALQKELDEEMPVNVNDIKDECHVISALEGKVITDGKDSVHIVVRRKALLERKLKLWQRAADKVSPEHVLRVKYLGEDGIDTGALAKEFLTETISNIGEKFFPNGSPVHSTNDIQNGNFRACGELVAVSLAQGGPPPCFLNEKVYNTLITDSNIDFTSPNLVEHLTTSELEMLDRIKIDVLQHQDTIIDHGYTGQINQANLESIIASIVVSIINRRILCLREFRKELNQYGLADIICQHPQATHNLFVCGQQNEVDADYVLSLLKPQLSEGSSRRVAEETIMDYFQDFLMDAEDERVTGYTEALAWASNKHEKNHESGGSADEEDDNSWVGERFSMQDITPAGVLGWLTGVKHREIGSVDSSIKVKFDHECLERNPNHTLCFPIVGACGRTITFPVMHMNTQESFKEVFLLGFSKSQAFGMR